jgi:hypothetical protein
MLISTICEPQLRRIQKLLRERLNGSGNLIKPHGNHGKIKIRQQTQTLVQWMENFINKTGDFMPHKCEIHLSVGSLKRWYDMYLNFCRTYTIHTVSSYETMRRKYKDMCDFVKIPKCKQFTRCDECDRLDEKIAKSKTPLEQKKWQILKNQHEDWQYAEREVYWKHRFLARRFPEKYMCLMIDGMDQKKTNVPRYFSRLPKSCDGLEQCTVTVIGAMMHKFRPLVHYMPNDFKKDCNVTIQILLNCLKDMKKLYGEVGKRWPSTLFLQLDGAGDNKNKHVLSLLAHLVRIGMFDEVLTVFHFTVYNHNTP